jgi:hypothetical protein
MSALSEMSILFGSRAGEIERAREIFTEEMRSFSAGVLANIRRARSDPWVAPRVRIDLQKEIENEGRTGYLSSQFAVARAQLRLKKGGNYSVVVADIRFGIEYCETDGAFAWQITVVPGSKFQQIDNALWRQWKTAGLNMPGAIHQDRANTVRFVLRPLGGEGAVTHEVAFNDVKSIFEFILAADGILCEAAGLDRNPEDSL